MKKYWALFVIGIVGALVALIFWVQELPQVKQFILTPEAKVKQWVAKTLSCKPQAPLSQGELFALAMQDYWKKFLRGLWEQDQSLNEFYPLRGGAINVTDSDCGLIRDKKGNPMRIDRKTCYPWKMGKYDTLEKLQEQLKNVPEHFKGVSEFNKVHQNPGGWIYDEIVQSVLQGEVYSPDEGVLYQPEHHNQDADFALLGKNGPSIYWYPRDCCRLMSYSEVLAEQERLNPPPRTGIFSVLLTSSDLPPGTRMEALHFLRVKRMAIDGNLGSDQGGAGLFKRGEIKKRRLFITDYFAVSPCGEVVSIWTDRIF